MSRIADMTERFPEGEYIVEDQKTSMGVTLKEMIDRLEQEADEGDFYSRVIVYRKNSMIVKCDTMDEIKRAIPNLLNYDLEDAYWHDAEIAFYIYK